MPVCGGINCRDLPDAKWRHARVSLSGGCLYPRDRLRGCRPRYQSEYWTGSQRFRHRVIRSECFLFRDFHLRCRVGDHGRLEERRAQCVLLAADEKLSSTRDSASGLPCSAVMISARSSMLVSIKSYQRRKMSARSFAVFCFQCDVCRIDRAPGLGCAHIGNRADRLSGCRIGDVWCGAAVGTTPDTADIALLAQQAWVTHR